MNDQPPRRFRSAPPRRQIGAPNVLSNEAAPNTLSGMAPPGRGTAPQPASAIPARQVAPTARPTIAPGRPATPLGRPTSTNDDRFEGRRPRLRTPSLGAIIFFAIILFNAARFFGVGTGGDGGSTPKPVPTSASKTTAPSATFGTVTFGKSLGKNCTLTDEATSFSPAVDVFWSAELLQIMPANAAITIVTLKNDRQIDYEYVPPDASVGKWQVFCAGPAKDELAGTYRIELWNAERSKLLAKGEFLRLGPTASPEPTASAS